MPWKEYTEEELATEPWFSSEHVEKPAALPRFATDSKVGGPCPAVVNGAGCYGQRYSSVGLPRIAWCAKCGRVWSYDGSPRGVQEQYIDCIPTTDAETDELYAAVKAMPEGEYQAVLQLTHAERVRRIGEVLAPTIARINERRKAAGIPLWKETVA